jgi:hypothetical protein
MAGPKTSATHPLGVDFLPDEALNLDGHLGLCAVPGRKQPAAHDGPWERDVDLDLHRLRHFYGAELLVVLLERGQYLRDELAALGIADLLVRAQRMGLRTDWAPMPAGDVPISLEQLFGLVERILVEVRLGRTVIVCCDNGRGRSGVVAAACVTALGASVDEALASVRALRSGAIETPAQLQSLRAYDELFRRRALQLADPHDVSDLFRPPELSGSDERGPSMAPLSRPGAATLRYQGLDDEAEAAGVPDAAPLRAGDLFHVAPGGVLSFGRGSECDVCITSGQLSRVHALAAFVPVAEGRIVVVDLNSRNGTWIGDKKVTVAQIGVGDEFTLARAYRFRFEAIG